MDQPGSSARWMALDPKLVGHWASAGSGPWLRRLVTAAFVLGSLLTPTVVRGSLQDFYVDMGDPTSEAGFNLEGWGNVEVPPTNRFTSPSGDRTKRLQRLRADSSLTFAPVPAGSAFRLAAEVEYGRCSDNFKILANGVELYDFIAPVAGSGPGLFSVLVIRLHTVAIPAGVVGSSSLRVTFRNTSTDSCGLAPVYNVRLQREADATPPPTPGPTAVPVPRQGVSPIAVEQTITRTGGSVLPTAKEATEYEHVVRVTNHGSAAQSLTIGFPLALGRSEDRPPTLGEDWGEGGLSTSKSAVSLLQDAVTASLSTEYGPDVVVGSVRANAGQAQTRGNSVVWDGQLSIGETLELRVGLANTPSSALVQNELIRGQTLNVADQRGVSVSVPPPARPVLPVTQRLVQPPATAADPVNGSRVFPETGFGIADDGIWVYFNRRGGLRTFGPPISRVFLLRGTRVQLFERGMLSGGDGGQVSLANLLEPPFLPYEALGDLTIPPADPQLIAGAPDPSNAEASQEFVRANAVEAFEGLPTRFYTTFLATVLFRDAFFDGQGDPGLVPGFSLEIWGLPTSGGWRDGERVLQRYQRGVMVYDSATGATIPASLGAYLRAVLRGDGLPELAAVASGSALWSQYNPGAVDWVDRPDELPDTNLVLAFEPD